MLAKKNRLTGGQSFGRVQDLGKVFQSDNFGIAYLKRQDSGPTRFGFVVSTKIAKDAVDRNTIRRHMSETVRQMIRDIEDGMDIVFLAKTSILRVPAEGIIREVRAALKRSGLTK